MEAKFNKRAMHKQYMKRSHNVLDPRFSPTATYPAGQNPPPATNSPSQTVVTPILGPPETVTQNGGPNPPPTSTPAQQPPPPPPTSKSSSPLLPPLLPTTSSSSTSAPPTTTSSTTPSTSAVPSTTATTPPPVASTTPIIQPSNTYSWTVPSISELATSSPTASASSTAAASSGVSTGAIVGGIAAAGVAIAGIVFAALFFIRRSRRLSENEFNAAAFRRQSAILIDDAASDRWNPRPPTMIERKMNNAPPSASGYGQQYAGLGAYGNGYNNYEQSSFSPGQVMPTSSSPPPANPMYTGYGQSPVGSPTSPAPYESVYNEYGQLTRQPSNGAYLNRQPSNGPYPNLSRQPSNGPYPNLARQNSFGAQALAGYDPVVPNASANPNAHYVDLSRSSVTPFQAAQYAEISRRLNDDPSKPTQHSSLALTAVSEETAVEPGVAPVEGKVYSDYASYAKQIGMDHQHLALPAAAEEPSSPIESPFADPAGARQLRAVNGDEDEDHVIGVATTTADPDSSVPAPIRTPSPAQTRTRVTSNPPMLPELNVPNRAFSPMAVSSSFHVPAALQAGLAVPAPAASGTPMRRENVSAVEKRPDTTYDEADAYGGI